MRGLAYDTEGMYIASASAYGDVQVWDTATGKAECTLRKAAPKVWLQWLILIGFVIVHRDDLCMHFASLQELASEVHACILGPEAWS